jgi:hypothetical protein
VLTDDKQSLSLYDHFDMYKSEGVEQLESCNIPESQSVEVLK